MTFRRGFKTEAGSTAAELRAELGLDALDPLDHLALAEQLAIPVVDLTDFETDCPSAVAELTGRSSRQFSACTVHYGSRRLIIVNDCHGLVRQRSSVTHECAHAVLAHPPMPPFNGTGCRHHNPGQEDEANWLAGELMVTRSAALRAARSNELSDVAELLGVSDEMLRWRVNMTGASKQAQREAARS